MEVRACSFIRNVDIGIEALGKERDRGVGSVGHWGGAPGTEVVFGWREREDRSYEEIGMGPDFSRCS